MRRLLIGFTTAICFAWFIGCSEDKITQPDESSEFEILEPQSDEFCITRHTKQILWQSNVTDEVDIYLLLDDQPVDTLAEGFDKENRFHWDVPHDLNESDRYQIKITFLQNEVSKTSGYFSIIHDADPNEAELLEIDSVLETDDRFEESDQIIDYVNQAKWYKFELDGAKVYRFLAKAHEQFDAKLMLFKSDAEGNLTYDQLNEKDEDGNRIYFLYQNDDDGIIDSVKDQPMLDFNPAESGIYYMRVSAWNNIPEEFLNKDEEFTGSYDFIAINPYLDIVQPETALELNSTDSLKIRWETNIEEELSITLFRYSQDPSVTQAKDSLVILPSVLNDGYCAWKVSNSISESDKYNIILSPINSTGNSPLADSFDDMITLSHDNTSDLANEIGFPYEIVHSIDYNGDVDYYEFTTQTDSLYIIDAEATEDSLNLKITIFDSDNPGSEIYSGDNLVKFEENEANKTYFAEIKRSESSPVEVITGKYKLKATETSGGNTFDDARTLVFEYNEETELNEYIGDWHKIDFEGDFDHFRFITAPDTTSYDYTFTVIKPDHVNADSIVVELFNSDDQENPVAVVETEYILTFTPEPEESEEYFIRVKPADPLWKGSYEFKVEMEKEESARRL